jgi:PAS domain S-box-containing protein
VQQQLLAEYGTDLLWQMTATGIFTDLSPSWRGVTGHEPAALLAASFFSLLHPDDLAIFAAALNNTRQPGATLRLPEYRLRHGDGSWHRHAATVTSVAGPENGGPDMLVGLAREVVEHRQPLETSRGLEDDLYRLLVENAEEAFVISRNKHLVLVNAAAEKLTGHSAAQLQAAPFTVFLHPEDRDLVVNRHLGRLAGDKAVPIRYRFRLLCTDGGVKWVEQHASLTTWQGQPAVLAVLSDITEQVGIERQLRCQTLALDQIEDAVTITDLEGIITYVNRAQARSQGCSKAELIGKTLAIYGLDSEQGLVHQEIVEKTLNRGQWRGKVVNRDSQGRVRQIDYRTLLLRDTAGGLVGICGTATDITEQMAAEEHLKLYENIVASTQDAIAFLDPSYRYIVVNDAYERFSGISRDRFVGLTVDDYLGEEVFQQFVKPLLDRCLQGEVINYQQWFDYSTLGRRFVEVSYFPYRDQHNRIAGVIANTRDITDRKRQEIALGERNAYLQSIFRASPVGIGVTKNRVLMEGNVRLCEMTGYAEDELFHQNARLLYPTEAEYQWVGEEKYEQIRQHGTGTVETRWQRKDGSCIDVLLSSTPIDIEDLARGVTFTALDITARKQAERQLKDQSTFIRRILDSTTAHIAILDQHGIIVDVNTPWNRFALDNDGVVMDQIGTGANYFCPWSAEYGDVTGAAEAFEGIRQVQRGERDMFEIEYPCHSPAVNRWFSLCAVPLQGDTGHVLVAHTDISARKRTEIDLSAALAEKEVLLREVHHRVKNNLAAIIGLMDMQRRYFDNQQGKEILTELSGRIRSMSLIHEKLYRSDNLARIDFQEYIHSLVSHLRTSYGSPRIISHVVAQGVALPLDIAVPCGMIINELITNALKYAFPQERPRHGEHACSIEVTMNDTDGVYTLSVADNGVGLPPGFDWTGAQTLGMVLVRMLGQHQLGGSYQLDLSAGTRFSLTFTSRKGKQC